MIITLALIVSTWGGTALEARASAIQASEHAKIALTISGGTYSGGTGALSPDAGRLNLNYVQGYANQIQGVINFALIPVLFSIAFAYFLYGVYKYFILGAADAKERAAGRQFILWGTIGFAAILSVWGLVYVVLQTFGLSPGIPRPGYPLL